MSPNLPQQTKNKKGIFYKSTYSFVHSRYAYVYSHTRILQELIGNCHYHRKAFLRHFPISPTRSPQ